MSILTKPPNILCPNCSRALIHEPNKRKDIMQAEMSQYFCFICPDCELVFALPKDTTSKDYSIRAYPFYTGPLDKNAFQAVGWKVSRFDEVQHDTLQIETAEKKESVPKQKEKCFVCDEETTNLKRHMNNKHEWLK